MPSPGLLRWLPIPPLGRVAPDGPDTVGSVVVAGVGAGQSCRCGTRAVPAVLRCRLVHDRRGSTPAVPRRSGGRCFGSRRGATRNSTPGGNPARDRRPADGSGAAAGCSGPDRTMAAEDNRCRWGKGAPFWRPSRDRPRPRPRPSPGNNPRAIDWAAAAAAASAPASVRASFDASFGLLPPSSP